MKVPSCHRQSNSKATARRVVGRCQRCHYHLCHLLHLCPRLCFQSWCLHHSIDEITMRMELHIFKRDQINHIHTHIKWLEHYKVQINFFGPTETLHKKNWWCTCVGLIWFEPYIVLYLIITVRRCLDAHISISIRWCCRGEATQASHPFLCISFQVSRLVS